MGLLQRLGLSRGPSWRNERQTLDREADTEDVQQLLEFVRSRHGVEFYVEPRTSVTSTTVVAIAADGEWKRRRVASPEAAAAIARKLGLPIYDAGIMGYPQRMRDWNAAHPERRMR